MIPTAEEFLESKVFNKTKAEIAIIMIEFAKLHVEAALKAASEKVNYYEDTSKGFAIDPNTVLNVYNLNQIK